MAGFKLPSSIFDKIAALPEFDAILPEPKDRRRDYLNTILSLALTEESWIKCCDYGFTPQDVFSYYDDWDRAGLFLVIPVALTSIRPDWCKWLKMLPQFTAPLRGRYHLQVFKQKKPGGMVIDLVLNKSYRHLVELTPLLGE